MNLANTVTDRVRRRAVRPAVVAVAVVVLAALIAGCGGGGSNPGVANVGTTSTTSSSTSSTASSNPASGGGGSGPLAGDPGSGSSSGGPGVHSGFAIASPGGRASLLKLAECMRAHGVPSFPDPNASGVIQGSSSSLNPQSPAFSAAMQKCRGLLGAGHAPSPQQQQQADALALKFSACMRSHGVTDFPDPQISGGRISITLHAQPGSNSDLDPNSPLFQHAQRACQADMPGIPKQGVSTRTGAKQ